MLCKSASALASPVRVDHPAADISNGIEVCHEQQCHRSYRHPRRGLGQSQEGVASSCMALSQVLAAASLLVTVFVSPQAWSA